MPEKILLVDDDNEFRSEFKDCFAEYEIIEARSGQDALKILKQPNEIALVILDIRLPDSDGTEVLREIKKNNPGLGIIVLTGFGSKDTAIDALRGHADDYIEKPFDIEETKKSIEKLLDSRKNGPEINLGDIKGKLEHAKRFIQRNILKKVTLKDVAEIVYLSPKYLSRVFKKNTGMGLSGYKIRLRIGAAEVFLKKNEYNISQIADKLSYGNVESFIRQFKKYTGFTPSQYRFKHGKSKPKTNFKNKFR